MELELTIKASPRLDCRESVTIKLTNEQLIQLWDALLKCDLERTMMEKRAKHD